MKASAFEAALLEALAGAAGAWVVTAELFDQFFVAVDDTDATLDLRLAVESPSDVYSSAQKLKS